MKRDKSHEEQIIRWANFIKNNPNSWQKQHTCFINSQINNANQKYEKLKKMPNGLKIIKELRLLRINSK
jgi:hypothetical protein